MTDTETPEVTARVEDTWAALEIDGRTETIRADSEEEVRHEILRRTVQIAADAQTNVHLIATDRDGEWRLVVTPDGEISETGVPSQTHGAHEGNDGVQDAASPADEVSAPPTLSTETVSGTGGEDGEDPRPYYDFSGPVDDTIEQTTFRETHAHDTGELDIDAISSDTVRRDDILPDRGPDEGQPSEDQQSTTSPTSIIGPPPSAASAPTAEGTTPLEPTSGEPVQEANAGPVATGAGPVGTDAEPDVADPGPVVIAATGEEIAETPAVSEASASATTAQPPLPTLADFRATQPPPVAGPASQGWRGAIRRGTGGLISPRPSVAERHHREAIASVTRSLSGPRTICIINPKGGAHKTTATMLIAATFGMYRGGYTLAWDNNETRGTLGWRAHQARHTNTAVDLLNDMERFSELRSARVGDLDNYVRSQAEAQFDVLASDEDAAATSVIDGEGFRRLHETLQRFYRIMVIDTGNNMRASNWEAAISAADQLVIVSAIREDTAGSAAWMVEGLARKGHEDKLRDAVTILSAPDKNLDAKLRSRLFDHFGSLTRDVVEVPYDPTLVSGAGIAVDALAPATREAWLTATATIANGL